MHLEYRYPSRCLLSFLLACIFTAGSPSELRSSQPPQEEKPDNAPGAPQADEGNQEAQQQQPARVMYQVVPDIREGVFPVPARPGLFQVPIRPNRLVPANAVGLPVRLTQLIRAKVEKDGESGKILMLAPSFRTEKREVQVTKMRAEQRERKVMVDRDGKLEEVTQTYNVMVPFTEMVEQSYSVPAGDKPRSIDWDQAKVYRLDGTEVTLDEAAKLLPQLRPVFLIPDQNQPIKAAPALVQQAMQADTLMIVTNAVVLP